MNNKIIDGSKMAKDNIADIKNFVEELQKQNKRTPHLKVVVVGQEPEAMSYIRSLQRFCKRALVEMSLAEFSKDINEDKLIEEINKLQEDKTIDGLMIEMPLPKHINPDNVLIHIKQEFDVDCMNDNNRRLLDKNNIVAPCTATGVMDMIEKEKIDLTNMEVLIIGRSKVVGNPLATLMINKSATVTVCSSKTKDLKRFTQHADLIVCAVGKINLITEDMIKDDSIIIDVGINYSNGKLCGDVDFDNVLSKVKKITPVPGGVGPVTTTMILKSLITLYKQK